MKVSYLPTYLKDGTVARQTIRVSEKEYEGLVNAFNAEIAMGLPRKDKYISTSGYEIFMKRLVRHKDMVVLNNTQLKFIKLFEPYKSCKRILDRNTILVIK